MGTELKIRPLMGDTYQVVETMSTDEGYYDVHVLHQGPLEECRSYIELVNTENSEPGTWWVKVYGKKPTGDE